MVCAAAEEMTMSRNAKGVATVLAIGTTNPPYCLYQEDFPETYFKVAQREHMVDLKMKLKRIRERTMIRKRHVNEETLKENQNRGKMALSLDLETYGIPKLGAEAATKAIQEWGQPKSSITHVIFHTCFGTDMLGADFQLAKLLGLDPSVKRFIFYHNGCYAGGTVLRLAKDLVENNAGGCVLAVCSEHLINGIVAPSEAHQDMLVAHAIFSDGVAVVIVGADPILSSERPIFRIVAANQTILPDSEDALAGQLRESSFNFHISRNVPSLISDNIEKYLVQSFGPIGISDWNSLFWIAHIGGAAILNAIEAKLDLHKEKLGAIRHVLSEYGNMSSPTVIFVLDEMRKWSVAEGKSTTGEGLEFGVLLGFGPEVTVETIVLQSLLFNVLFIHFIILSLWAGY